MDKMADVLGLSLIHIQMCIRDRAQSFMDSTVLFNRAGWKAVMGIEKQTGKPVLNQNPQLAKTNQKEERCV